MQRSYHHGNLRTALLAAAAAEVQTVGAAQLSLRELARRAGVSHAAPAHHFGDKRGLFTALATEGFRLLHQRTTPTLAGDTALIAAGQCYVEFALDHPGHFAVMFDPSLLDDADPDYQRERAAAFAVLYEAIRQATDAQTADVLEKQTLSAWIAVHGLATLWLSGNLPYPREARLVAGVFTQLIPALARIATASQTQASSPSSATRARVHRNPPGG